jgi:asparagine synthase (glutamine-hydrolysing)
VRLRLRSDVPIGTCLSGGIDSSAIAVLVSHLLATQPAEAEAVGRRLRTFTAYFEEPGFDERPFATAVVDRTGAKPYWVTFDDRELVELLPSIVEMQDEPFGSTSMCAQWFVMRRAREAGVKVVLDGQGSDETFAGYRASYAARLGDLLAAGQLAELMAEAGAWRRLRGAGRLDAAVMVARTFAPEGIERRAHLRLRGTALAHPELPPGAALFSNGGVFRDRLRRNLHLLLTRRGLPELLRYEDRNSMAHSLESRVPFLDYRLVETVFSLRGGELIRGGLTKSVLRRALGDLLPPVVRDRVDKLGFVTPERSWLNGALGELAAETFASRRFAERGFVNAAAARARLERHRRGELRAGFELWRALNVELWARAFLDR